LDIALRAARHRRRSVRATLIAFFTAVLAFLAAGGALSETPVKVIVPYPPGGGADVLARVVADQVGSLHGPTMVVEDRPGAGTIIGTVDVVRATPDGTMLLFANNSSLLVPHLRKLDYDPLTSLTPICSVASTPTVIVVNSASPYRKLADLLDAARKKPGALTYGAAPGAVSHVSVEMLLHTSGTTMTMVPFQGTPPQVNAVLGGHVDLAFVDYPAAAELLKAGKLRALAVASLKRIEWLPDVPTVSESGFPDFEMELWYGLFAPAKTPPQTVTEMQGWLTKFEQVSDLKSRLAGLGMRPDNLCGTDFAAFLRKQYDGYGRIIRDANIKAE
jgi:tripartite-type tricarboxylate transporter receptor subunit TctC